jgi:Tol biopolymer transport system component
MWVDRDGNEEPLPVDPDLYRSPKISPDGAKVALAINKGGNEDIYVWDILMGTWTRLTSHEASDDNPLWIRDGKRIVFSSSRDGIMNGIYWTLADSTGRVEKLSQASSSGSYLSPSSLSIDGKTLVLQEAILGGISGIDFNIGTLSLEGDHEYESLLYEDYDEGNPKISPDGKWMAYSSNEFSEVIGEIYVRPFPDVDKGKWPVSQGGGTAPLWSPDGGELFYLTEDSVMVVQVETEQMFDFKFKKAKVLFTGNFMPPSSDDNSPWDINPIDKRFLMKKSAPITEELTSASSQGKIIVVTNWFEELKEKVPVD